MARISTREFEAVLDCAGRIHDCESLNRLPHVVLTEVTKLVGADSAIFNYIAPSVPHVVAVALPELPDHEATNRRFKKHLSGHPVFRNYLATGDGSAFKLSDFTTERQYHASPLYKGVFHDIGYEDQLSIALFPPGSELVVLSLARDRRSFTEKDRAILNLLRPQIARAYRRLERTGLLLRSLDAGKDGIPACSVFLEDGDRPVEFGAQAARWLAEFFPGRPRDTAGLPDEVVAWLRSNRRATPHANRDELIRERAGRRLRIRVLPGWTAGVRMLVLGMETIAAAAQTAHAERLTHREIDVLLEVERGKSNSEAAAALGISPLTVKKHLENIFEKLGVPNRTAAVSRFRQAGSPRKSS